MTPALDNLFVKFVKVGVAADIAEILCGEFAVSSDQRYQPACVLASASEVCTT